MARRDPVAWMRQEYSDIVKTVRSHATKVAGFERIRGGSGQIPPEQMTANGMLSPLKINATLSSSGNTLTLSPVGNGIVPLYGDADQGWVNIYLLSAVTLDTTGSTSGKPYDVYVYYNSQVDPPAPALETVVWTNETTRSVAITTQDGETLKATDTTRHLIAVCRYNGSTMLVPKYDPNGEIIFGTGDPRNNVADPHTGVGMSAGGVTFGAYVWQFWAAVAGVVGVGFNAAGQLLAGAGKVIIDVSGITTYATSLVDNAASYKFYDSVIPAFVARVAYAANSATNKPILYLETLGASSGSEGVWIRAKSINTERSSVVNTAQSGNSNTFATVNATAQESSSPTSIISLTASRFDGVSTTQQILNLNYSQGLFFGAGNPINEFSIDGALTDNSDAALPTEKAVKTYVDARASASNFVDLTTNQNVGGEKTLISSLTVQGTVNTATGGNTIISNDGTNGPFLAANTNSAGNSTINAAAMRIKYGGAGFQVAFSPATAIGSPRTFTTPLTVGTTGLVSILQPTLGNEVLRIESTATNDDPSEKIYQNRVTTTNATPATIHTVACPASTTIAIEVDIVARRTGGVSGTAQDGARYKLAATFKNVAGTTATQIGTTTNIVTHESQAAWDATIAADGSTNAIIQVTGAASNDIVWHCTVKTWVVGT